MIKNVLIVDDDKEMLLALKEGFKRYQESFAVLLAEDGLQALEKLKASVISLVVTDLKMPRMDGFELLAHVMEHYPDIPVIMITGISESLSLACLTIESPSCLGILRSVLIRSKLFSLISCIALIEL